MVLGRRVMWHRVMRQPCVDTANGVVACTTNECGVDQNTPQQVRNNIFSVGGVVEDVVSAAAGGVSLYSECACVGCVRTRLVLVAVVVGWARITHVQESVAE
jgi:hypothetical protein